MEKMFVLLAFGVLGLIALIILKTTA